MQYPGCGEPFESRVISLVFNIIVKMSSTKPVKDSSFGLSLSLSSIDFRQMFLGIVDLLRVFHISLFFCIMFVI